MTHDPNSYDLVPYTSHSFPQTHPDRLATIATLFGMRPPAVSRCRVLELGCASGGNLIPLAVALPGSRFVGIELSGRQVADGRRIIEQLGLENIRLEQRSITDVAAAGAGEFDYIICHGVYSWVDRDVRDRILAICADHLATHGVAYVSYNTYPGWHMRGTIRDIMCYHARKFQTPQERINHARALLDFLAKAVPEGNAYGIMLRAELELLRDAADAYVLHDHLEAVNEPVYFYQFLEHAASKGLEYLAESEIGTMALHHFPPEVASVVQHLAANLVELEQYLDFLRNRMFRQTLLCRRDVALDRLIDPKRLSGLFVAAPIRSEGSPTESPAPAMSPGPATFVGPAGKISTTDQLLTAALATLSRAWPAAVEFDQLARTALAGVDAVRAAHQAMPDADAEHAIASLGVGLIDCYARRFVDLHVVPPPCAPVPGDRPVASPLARLQAHNGRLVTNLRHQTTELDDLGRAVISIADGSRDRRGLTDGLLELIERGSLTMHSHGEPVRDRAAAHSLLTDSLEQSLGRLARDSLLLA